MLYGPARDWEQIFPPEHDPEGSLAGRPKRNEGLEQGNTEFISVGGSQLQLQPHIGQEELLQEQEVPEGGRESLSSSSRSLRTSHSPSSSVVWSHTEFLL